MKLKTSFILSLLLAPTILVAQTKFKAKVYDCSTDKPIHNAVIWVLQGDTLIDWILTDADGRYSMDSTNLDDLTLYISAKGHELKDIANRCDPMKPPDTLVNPLHPEIKTIRLYLDPWLKRYIVNNHYPSFRGYGDPTKLIEIPLPDTTIQVYGDIALIRNAIRMGREK